MASARAPSSSGSDPRRGRWVTGPVALCLVAGGCAAGEQPAADVDGAPAPNAVIERVVDGDTVDARIGDAVERIRLTGIDTPEVARDGRPGECFGAEASAFTRALLPPGTPVRVERDVVSRDDYGRVLGYLFTDDGRFINAEIVRRGFATPLTIEPNSLHATTFVAAATAAERDGLGLWEACSG